MLVNGSEVLEIGKVGASEAESEPRIDYMLIPIYTGEDGTVEVVCQYANFVHREGGGLTQMHLSTAENIDRMRRSQNLYSLVLGGSLCLFGMYFLLFAVFQGESKYVFLAVICALLGLGDQNFYVLHLLPANYNWAVAYRFLVLMITLQPCFLLLLLQKLFGDVRTVAMENETYLRAYRIFCSNAYRICVTDMDEKGMCASALERTEADLAYVMPAHQFPTGAVMPVGRRLELLGWAKEKENRYLIEDDYDSEFRYKGKPIPALQSLDRQEKVIYMGTFSKSIAPAIRVSYLVLPRRLLTLYEQNCSFLSSTVSRIDQAVLNRFIAEGYFERYLNKMRKVYRQKQEKMLECLEPFRDRFVIAGEEAGLHILLMPKDKDVTEQMLIQKARQQGCKVYGLSDYQIIKKETHRVMLGYASLSLSGIEEGMGLLEKAWL